MRKPFEKIKLSNLHTLCGLLADTEVQNLGYIKRRYLEKGLSFDDTLSLLEALNIVKVNQDELVPSKVFLVACKSLDEFKIKFINILFSSNGAVSTELKNFLLNFQSEGNKIFFKASELQKIKFSDIRNLLLELEFIYSGTGHDSNTYYVKPDFSDLFFKEFTRIKLSPSTLKKRQLENESIGLAAEQAIIEYELSRLAVISVLPNEIEHTSQVNVLAGYDIKSFEDYLDTNVKRIYRYIEVKAVSIDNYKFYWSRIEMEIAKVYGEKYYLYLLPVTANNIFELDKMIIKRNPFKSVYSNALEWNKIEESISFSQLLMIS